MSKRQNEARDPLNLRSLPPLTPDRDGWPEIQAVLLQQRKHRRTWKITGGALASAATVLLAVALTVAPPAPESDPAGIAGHPATPHGQEVQPEPLKKPSIESLMAMSRQLENRVRQYQGQLGDLPAQDLVYQVELQDLVVQVDEGLSRNPESTALWSQRVSLLMDVTSLYENNLRRDYYRMASL